MSKVSVVVPIYNVEEYLPRCLDSIVAQTYKDIEIILVDDGSPDNAGAICDEYATKDERIRVFHIPNGGVGKARQLGVENSTGEYIVFVDPDDWLPLDSVEVLYSNMSDDVDLVVGSYDFYNNEELETHKYIPEVYTALELTQRILLRSGFSGSPWGRLYRKQGLEGADFPATKRAQDVLMNLVFSLKIRGNIKVIDDSVYNYCKRESSAVNMIPFTLDGTKYYIKTTNDILEKYHKRELYDKEFYIFSFYYLRLVITEGHKLSLKDLFVQDIYKNLLWRKLGLRLRVKFILFFYLGLMVVLKPNIIIKSVGK